MRKFGSLQPLQEHAVLPIPTGGCSIFVCHEQWCGCQCLGFFTRVQTLMHAIAHGDCASTVRESSKVGFGRKIPCRIRESNPRQYCTWHFGTMFCQLSYHLHSLTSWSEVSLRQYPSGDRPALNKFSQTTNSYCQTTDGKM